MFPSAGLDFYYQFSNDISSVNGIERFSGYNFTSVGSANVLDVYQTPAAFGIFLEGSEQSDYADRTNFGVVGFSFVPNGASKVNPGTTSYTQILRTSARYYTAGNFGLLDGIGDNAAGFATAAVPEPATGTLLLVGLAMGGWISSRRRRTCAVSPGLTKATPPKSMHPCCWWSRPSARRHTKRH